MFLLSLHQSYLLWPRLKQFFTIRINTVMSHSKAYKSPKCLALESPRRTYDALLHRIRNDLGERQMESFQFVFRYEIPRTVLERRNPLQWFTELENRRLLSPGDLSRLEDFLELESLNLRLEDVRSFQAKQRVVLFFQRGVEAKILELRLGKVSYCVKSESKSESNLLQLTCNLSKCNSLCMSHLHFFALKSNLYGSLRLYTILPLHNSITILMYLIVSTRTNFALPFARKCCNKTFRLW